MPHQKKSSLLVVHSQCWHEPCPIRGIDRAEAELTSREGCRTGEGNLAKLL